MSKIPYIVNVEEYVCSVLEEMRRMNKHRDYSGLAAAIERIQHHVNRMEGGLDTYRTKTYKVNRILNDEKLSAKEKVAKVKEITENE